MKNCTPGLRPYRNAASPRLNERQFGRRAHCFIASRCRPASGVGRSAWGARKRSALDGADIVFLDPDNGIGGETQKHATFSEIRLLRKPGRAIVFITFLG